MTHHGKMIEALVFIAHEIIDRVYDEDGTHRDMADDIAAAVLDLCGPKPLVWEDADRNGGLYSLVEIGNDFSAYYEITQERYDLASVCFGIRCHSFDAIEIWKGPKDQAQAAAEAHHIAAYWAQTKIGGE